jgi:hypothetical protein
MPFMGKVNLLVDAIRKRHSVSLGEACATLNVDPDSIRRRYAPVIVDLCADIRWDGKRFETILEAAPLDGSQKKVDEYVRRL